MNNPTDINQACKVKRNSLNKSDRDVKLEPMSNQAGEDEIVAILTNEYGYLNQRLDGGQNEEDAVAHYTDKLLAIIRTEKLKLLAEVRERVIGGDDEQSLRELSRNIDYEDARVLFEINTGRNVLKDEQLVELTKMEAEL